MRVNPTPAVLPSAAVSAAPARGDATREALVRAATEVFARSGLDAASTRDIAEQAGANQALIGYHFGGKEGLYLAVFDAIAAQVRERIGPRIEEIEGLLAAGPGPVSPAARRRAWLPPLLGIVDGLLGLMLSRQTQHWAQLILREQSHPTAAFERLYEGFQGHLLGLLVELVQRLRPDIDATDARLRVVALIGEVIAWRATRATAQRLFGWTEPDEQALQRIRASVRRHVTALLAS